MAWGQTQVASRSAAFRTDQLHFGKIKSFNPEKGWGFIISDKVGKITGKREIFFMRSEVPKGENLNEGDTVNFHLRQGLKGFEAASLVLLPSVAVNVDRQFTGTVKSYNEQKGWGFIDCSEAKSIYKKDIFFHKREVEGVEFSVGDAVEFTIQLSSEGRPEASGLAFS